MLHLISLLSKRSNWDYKEISVVLILYRTPLMSHWNNSHVGWCNHFQKVLHLVIANAQKILGFIGDSLVKLGWNTIWDSALNRATNISHLWQNCCDFAWVELCWLWKRTKQLKILNESQRQRVQHFIDNCILQCDIFGYWSTYNEQYHCW